MKLIIWVNELPLCNIFRKVHLESYTTLFRLSFFLLLFCYSISTQSQSLNNEVSVDSLQPKSLLKKIILPTGLIVVGSMANNSDFEKRTQTELRNFVGNDYQLRIDDYLQYVPIAEMYIADLVGVKAKNHWFNQSKYLLVSNILSAAITHSLKRIIKKTRPDGSLHSFPSGHTTLAFTNAAVLNNEFRETSIAIAYSGYALSTITGAFRVINNKHWLSDVLVGAGIGIIATELVYHFEPFKNFNPFNKSREITFSPKVNYNHYGFYFAYCF